MKLKVICLVYCLIQLQADMNLDKISQLENLQLNDNIIQGVTELDGQLYSAHCECGDANAQKCSINELTVTQDKQGQGATFTQIRDLVGQVQDLELKDIQKTSFMCIDGRANGQNAYTLGGDSGDFLLALSVYESIIDRALTFEEIKAYFNKYIATVQRFVLCTDEKAVDHLRQQLNCETFDIQRGSCRLKEEILEFIADPHNQGDIHIRLMLKYPEKYSIRSELLQQFLKIFYSSLWEQRYSQLDLEVLIGDHKESAFVEIRIPTCDEYELVPILYTKNQEVSVFVNHVDASNQKRKQLAKFFQDEADYDKMYSRMSHHALSWLEVTGLNACKDLPFFTAVLQ